MMRRVSAVTGMCALMLLLAVPSTAGPITMVLLDSLGNTSGIIVDGGVGDIDPTAGVVSFSGVIGDWNVNTTSGAAGLGSMDLQSFNASANTTSSLFVRLTQQDHTSAGSYALSFSGAVQNGSAAYGAFADLSNDLFGQTHGIGAIGTFLSDSTPQEFSGTTVGAGPGAGLYSLTQLFVVTGSGAGQTLFGGQGGLDTVPAASVPEPGSLLLLGAGLAIAGIGRARRRR